MYRVEHNNGVTMSQIISCISNDTSILQVKSCEYPYIKIR